MSGPWFCRYAGFGYRPITLQGRLVVAMMALIAIPCGFAWVSYADTRPLFASVAGALAVMAAVVGHAIVLWKMDWGFGRR